MQLQIITPEKIIFSGEIAMVTAPGTEGEFGVLPGHAPLVSTLRAGDVVVDLPDKTQQRFAVSGGVAEVTPEYCRLLVELTAEEKAAA